MNENRRKITENCQDTSVEMAENSTVALSSTLLGSTDIPKEQFATLRQQLNCQWKWIIALCFMLVILTFGLIGIVIYLSTTNNYNLHLPPPNHVQYVIRNGNINRSQILSGKYLTGWEVGMTSGNDEITTTEGDKFAITIKKAGVYDLGVQVVFKNKAPHNYVEVFINGYEWKRTPHSSQMNMDGEVYESLVPVKLFSVVNLDEGDKITVSLVHPRRKISVLHKDTYIDISERR